LDLSFKRHPVYAGHHPSDITGFSLVNFKTGEMEYRAGLVMSQIVLAVEINRTSPKDPVVAARGHGGGSGDGGRHHLPGAKPFIVLGDPEPGDFVGTYPLPEAQLDRFFHARRHRLPVPGRGDRHPRPLFTNLKPMEELRAICTSSDILALSAGGGHRLTPPVRCAPTSR
jgi:MoxR-like ATPase